MSSTPPRPITNDLGICTVSLGSWKHHSLPNKIKEAAKAGFRAIDLFDEDWAEYLESHGLDPEALWEPTQANLKCAHKLNQLIKSLGMYIVCTQPLRNIEGAKDPIKRAEMMDLAARRFPFMRAFDTDLMFMCANVRTTPDVTSDFQTVVRDLQDLGDRAAAYACQDGGRMIKIGYEALSWAQRNTWSSTWEIVRAVNRPNVGLIVDSFNLLAVEFADPYAQAGHGMFYPTLEEALDVLCMSLASFVATVPADKIFFVQVADAQLVDSRTFLPPKDAETPRLLPWSRMHRLYPMEQHLGGYMPTDLVTAAILATGYKGALGLEVFTKTLHQPHHSVPREHAARGIDGLKKLLEAVTKVPKFWTSVAQPTSVKWGTWMLTNKKQYAEVIESKL
jgi:4-hydroxyphenylpyruvate dioxygenase